MKRHVLSIALAAVSCLALATTAQADLQTGMDYYKAGKYAEAAAEFQALVDGSPSYDFGHFMIGNSLLKMKKPAEAVKNFEKALELNGDKFEYHQSLAKAYYDQKNFGKTIAALKTAEPLAANDTQKFTLYYMRGMSYSAEKKWSETIQDLQKAGKIKPNATIDRTIGTAYYELNDYAKAAPLLEKAAAKKADKALQMRLVNAYLSMGGKATDKGSKSRNYGKALTFAKKYRDTNATDVEAHNLLGRAALGAEDFSQAEQSFKAVISKDGKHCYAKTNLGKTYLAMERWTEAENAFNDAIQCSPKLGVAHESLGVALQKQKKYQQAIAAYEKAKSIQPKPFIDKAIASCQKNIEINAFNDGQEKLKAEQEAEARKAEEEFKKKQAELEKWKRQQEDQ